MSERIDRERTVILSYAGPDRPAAQHIASTLRSAGHVPVALELDVRPGSDFVSLIDSAISSADLVIVLISKHYVNSPAYSRNDWIAAIVGRTEKIIPIRLDDTDTLFHLGPYEVVDYWNTPTALRRPLLLCAVSGQPWIPDDEPQVHRVHDEGAPALRSSLRPRFWNLPLEPAQYFTGRDDLLTDLHREAEAGKSTILTHRLTGVGGVGKTRLAAEFALRHRNEYDLVWWVRAGVPSSMNEDLARLGETLGVSTSHEQWNVTRNRVREWLENSGQRWLLVFDDATDPALIESALPTRGSGHVLITARRESNWPPNARQVHVDVLKTQAAAEYLLARTASDDDTGAHRLARELGGLALALEQAAAYVLVHGSTFKEYSRELARSLRGNTTFRLGRDRRRGLQGRNARRTLEAAYRMSVSAALNLDSQADLLLNSFAFLDASPLALDLVEQLDPRLKLSKRTLRILARLALIEFAADESIVVHPLCQEVVGANMRPEQRSKTLDFLLNWISARMPDDSRDWRNWEIASKIVPHALALLDKYEPPDTRREQVGNLLHRLGKYSEARGDSQSAAIFIERAMYHVLEAQNSDTTLLDLIWNDLGVVLAQEGDWSRAVEIGVDVLQRRLRQAVNGQANSEDIMFLSNLAAALADAGRLQDAADFYNAILTRHADLHLDQDPVAPAVLVARHNWATVLEELEEFETAAQIHREVLASREELYGRAHPETIFSLIGLASVLGKMNSLDEALQNATQALQISERIFGEYHPATLSALECLAALKFKSGDQEGALFYARRAHGRRVDSLGPEHPTTLDALHNLASVARQLGQTDRAAHLLEKVVDLRSKVLGPQHPKTIDAVKNLAETRGAGETPSEQVTRVREVLRHVASESRVGDAGTPTRRRLFDVATAISVDP